MNARQNICVLLFVLCAVFFCAPARGGQEPDLYKQAASAFQKQNFEKAAVLFEQSEATNPDRGDALLMAAKARVHLQQFDTAENELRKYLIDNPTSADAWYLLGFVLNRENKPIDSLDVYTRAAGLSAPTGDDLKIVALDYELLNDNPNAIRWLEVAVQKDPANKEAWYFLGRAYYTASRLPAARRAFDRVLELDPRDARAENNIGLILESGGKTEEALATYRNAIAWQKESSPSSEQPYLNLGSLLITMERTREAVAPLQKAVALAPNDAQCHLRLGTAYLHLGELNEAERELREAVRLAPDNAAAHYQLGRCYKQSKKIEAAKSEFDRVAEIQSQAVEKLKTPQQ
jgi:tetratricopeptide (TPR) repeat protein